MKITVSQLLSLEIEILGGSMKEVINERVVENVFVGLMNEELSFKCKHQLQRLMKKLIEEKELYSETEKKLFISLGAVEKDGQLMIEKLLEDGSPNPALKKLTEERIQIISQEIDLGEFKFDIDDFNFKSKSTYPVFMHVAFS